MNSARSFVVLLLAAFSAGCTDRTAESYRVYDAVLAAMSAGVIQLHQPPLTEGPIAIVDHTAPDGLDHPEQVRASSEKALREMAGDTANAYFRVRNKRRGLERRFQTGLTYELVASQTDEERFPAGIVTFSPVGFSRSGNEALVFVSHYCGMLCASGHFVLLSAHADGWRIEQARLMVMS